MLDRLSASRAPGRLDPGRVLLAAALHGAVIFGAIKATAPHTGPASGQRQVQLVDFVLTPAQPEPQTAASADPDGVAAAPQLDELLAPPVDLPTGIPPINPGPALDLSRLRSFTAGPTAPPSGTPGAESRIIAAGEADQPASVLVQPSPRYPPVLQQAGLEGKVLLEFVIDTAGHPEPASIRIIERSREGFDAAALETIQHSLFRPARVRGGLVRQRTLQWVVFRITTPG
jgi:protein TonB